MNYKEKIIKFFTFLGGIYFIVEFLLPQKAVDSLGLNTAHEKITNGFIAVGIAALALGLINLFYIHGSKIVFKKQGWINSFALIFSLVFTSIILSYDWYGNSVISSKAEKFSNLAEFSKVIISDFEAKKKSPSFYFRVQKLVESIENENDIFKKGFDAEINYNAETSSNNKYKETEELKQAMNNVQNQITKIKSFKNDKSNIFKLEVNEANIRESGILNELSTLTPLLSSQSSLVNSFYKFKYSESLISKLYTLIFEGFFNPLGSAMFSLLAMYIASAAYRAFRIKTVESSLLMISAVLVILGQTPFGLMIYDGFPYIRLWLLEVPNSAAFRAIKIGASVAGLVLAFRMLLSIESTKFSKN